MSQNRTLDLFGSGDPMKRAPWDMHLFSGETDQARGGKSTTSIALDADDHAYLMFSFNLRPDALNPPAAFALQRTIESWSAPDLSEYDALVLDVRRSDGAEYTIVLKDTPITRRPDGRLASTVSWEHNFSCPGPDGSRRVVLHFKDFKPFYRGKETESATPLDRSNILSLSIMCRSFFGKQKGRHTLQLFSITAYKYRPSEEVHTPPNNSKKDSEKPGKRSSKIMHALRRLVGKK